jgi:L-fucose isomerase-like protein
MLKKEMFVRRKIFEVETNRNKKKKRSGKGGGWHSEKPKTLIKAAEEEMEEDTTVYQQLRKLAGITRSEEALDHILSTLWKTRRTGLRPPDKSHIQSLLNLPSPAELDPVRK